MMEVPFLDLAAQNEGLHDEIMQAWDRILSSARYVSGAEVAGFEEDFAAACEVDHSVAVSNGTEALTLTLRALGVGPGDRVVVPANTFIATAEAVSNVGALPHLVDCDPTTFTIDATAAAGTLEAPDVVGVIPVHLYGQPADMDPLLHAAAATGTWVMEDAAQAHLARYRDRAVGSLARAAAFSFYPGKNLGAPGEGGAITTDDPDLAATVRALRDHGQTEKYHSAVVGSNARMIELVAAVLRIKLRRLDDWTRARRRIAARYVELLADVPGISVPHEPAWARNVYHLFVVHVADRDRVRAELDDAGISTGLHYPIPIHLQPAYATLGHGPGSFPAAEANAANGISLPMFPELTDHQVEYVAEQLTKAAARRTVAP